MLPRHKALHQSRVAWTGRRKWKALKTIQCTSKIKLIRNSKISPVIFRDNFSDHGLFKTASLGPTQTCSITGLYDTILYLGLRLFKLSEPWLRILTGLRWITADSFNHLVHYLLSSKLNSLLNSGRVAHIISVIEESIFDPPAPEMELLEIQQQTKQTLEAFRTYLPQALRSVLGDKYDPSTKTLFNVLQEPLLNKQLAYTLLEILLVKLFPELRIWPVIPNHTAYCSLYLDNWSCSVSLHLCFIQKLQKYRLYSNEEN